MFISSTAIFCMLYQYEFNNLQINIYIKGTIQSKVLVSVKGISHIRHSFVELDLRLMETYVRLLVPSQAMHSVLSKTTLLVQINSEMVEVLN